VRAPPPPLPHAPAHLPPEAKSDHSLGIDFGASKIRFGVFSRNAPQSTFDVNVLDPVVGVDEGGNVVVGRDADLFPIPPIRELLGRQFNDPAVSDSIRDFPIPVFEHPESHTCALNVSGHAVTPESVTAALFEAVRTSASASVGAPVVDASIAVPTMLTSAQREAIRDAAESAGLRIAHITSGSVMAARAMKVSGELSEPGLSVIVDIGASKTEVSLIQNDDDGVREVRTAGSDRVGGNQVRDAVVARVLPIVKKRASFVSPVLRAELEAQAEVAIATDGRIAVPDLGNGVAFEAVLSAEDIAACCAKVADEVKGLVGEVVKDAESSEVHCVRCIGGGTRLPVLRDAVQAALPAAQVRQFDPDELISCGATLDGADRTERLPPRLKTKVITVVPYSIGISMIGGVVSFVVQRGESLPAAGEMCQTTTLDDQDNMKFYIWQGEHVLTEFSDPIGSAVLNGLPKLPRGQLDVVCRVEYNEDGILQFSAREQTTGASVESRFTAKTDFSDSDRSRLALARPHDAADEMRIAETRHLRRKFAIDLERAEQQTGSAEFTAAVAKYRQWLHANETGPVRLFLEKRHEAVTEFLRLNPAQWDEVAALRPDIGFREIWPCAPIGTKSGSVIIRFFAKPGFPSVDVDVEDLETHEKTDECEFCQFPAGDRVESVVRVLFPHDGKFKVSLYAGPGNGATTLFPVFQTGVGRDYWRVDVSGCPAPPRPLQQVIAGREFMPLPGTDRLKVNPASSCVQIPGTQYTFSCEFQGTRLGINGRPSAAVEDPETYFPEVTERPQKGGWSHQDCLLDFPALGVWRVLYWLDGNLLAIQTVVAGATMEPTDEERVSLAASLVD
jgi:molecular chaperone DnaK (HSP70)